MEVPSGAMENAVEVAVEGRLDAPVDAFERTGGGLVADVRFGEL